MASEKNQPSINEVIQSDSELTIDSLPRKKVCTEDRSAFVLNSVLNKELCSENSNKKNELAENASDQSREALAKSLQLKIDSLESELALKNQEITLLKKESEPVQEPRVTGYHADQKKIDLYEDLKEKNRLLIDQIYYLNSKLKIFQASNRQESAVQKDLASLKEKNHLLQTQCKLLKYRLSEIKNGESNPSAFKQNCQINHQTSKDDINNKDTSEQASPISSSDPKKILKGSIKY